MLSIWMACEARRSKTTHGDGGVVIAKSALVGRALSSRRELRAMGALLCDYIMWWSHFMDNYIQDPFFKHWGTKAELLWGSELIALAIKRGSFFLRCWYYFMENYMFFFHGAIFYALGNKSGAFVRQWIDRKAIKRGSFFLRCWFHFMDNYMYFITWAELIGFGYYMLYLMMHPTHYSITWFHTTGSLSQKQVWTCLMKTGNDSAILQGHDITWSLLTN